MSDLIPDGCIRVTVEDGEGPPEVAVVGPHDYVLLAVGDCHIANTQVHANGTHVLTVKGRRR